MNTGSHPIPKNRVKQQNAIMLKPFKPIKLDCPLALLKVVAVIKAIIVKRIEIKAEGKQGSSSAQVLNKMFLIE